MPIDYQSLHKRSLDRPEEFWAEAAQAIDWVRPFDRVCEPSPIGGGMVRWFPGGMLNTCFNLLDRHVRDGRGDQAAVIYESPVTGVSDILSYRELLDRTAVFAGALKRLGVVKGDRVVIYMATTPEALVAMMACARLGAVHSVVFGGFASHELAARIDDCTPRVVVAGSCGIEPKGVIPYKPLLDEALQLAVHSPERVIVHRRPQCPGEMVAGRDIAWDEAIAGAEPADCVAVYSHDPLYILYTSGTTGKPKGVVRDNGGHAVAIAWTMRNLYGVEPGETYWAASDIGWAVGHSYMLYGPLLTGNVSVVYEGKPVGTPDAGAFWRLIEKHQVRTLFTAPTAIRAIKREDPDGTVAAQFDLSSLRALFLAGERSDGDTVAWSRRHLGVPVIDHWWQTETGWPITGNPLGFGLYPAKAGSVSRPMPGWDVRVLEEGRDITGTGQTGKIALRLPLPPCALMTLWNGDDRFREAYLTDDPGFYTTGDAGVVDADGDIYIVSRIDDVINVAGHRLSTSAMEEVLCAHPDVAEAAVIGLNDDLKGQVPLGLLVLRVGAAGSHREVVADVVRLVRERIGPVAFFKQAVVVERLPKTRSGKILRGTIKKLADGTAWTMPATIDDPLIMDEIAAALRQLRAT